MNDKLDKPYKNMQPKECKTKILVSTFGKVNDMPQLPIFDEFLEDNPDFITRFQESVNQHNNYKRIQSVLLSFKQLKQQIQELEELISRISLENNANNIEIERAILTESKKL